MADLKRIMTVEDDEDIRALLSVALQAVAGYELEICSSGADAIEKIAGFSPDLLVLDAVMPELDGIALLATRYSPSKLRTEMAAGNASSVRSSRLTRSMSSAIKAACSDCVGDELSCCCFKASTRARSSSSPATGTCYSYVLI